MLLQATLLRVPPRSADEELQLCSPIEVIDRVLSGEDLLKCLLRHLGVVDICKAAAVCKLWRQVCDSDELWTRVAFESGHPISRKQVSGVRR